MGSVASPKHSSLLSESMIKIHINVIGFAFWDMKKFNGQ